VALGRALVRRPQLFLLDEPLSNVDAGLRRQLRQLIKQLQRESGTTTLHVTHDQEEALALADLLVVMDAGRVQQVGSPREVYERPRNRFVAGFVGPAMNFVEGRVALRDGAVLFEGEFGAVEVGAALAAWAGQAVTAGFRPEAATWLTPREGVRPGDGHAPGDLRLRGRVLLVEYLGDRVDVTLQGPATTWTVRPDAGQSVAVGQDVEAAVPLQQCRWFAGDQRITSLE
jgi:ABC-type sugar transport system ATPase subunit